MKKESGTRPRKRRAIEVVRLEDLAPRKRLKGGSRRLLFGERVDAPEEDQPTPAKERERPRRSGA
jgi:hypothetical protein